MIYKKQWNMIINSFAEKRVELPTVPRTKRDPVWFSATSDGEIIYIDKAINNKPSSKLSMKRKLNFKTFQSVYPFYIKRENGESVSKEVSALSVNQVYYYSLIKHFCK